MIASTTSPTSSRAGFDAVDRRFDRVDDELRTLRGELRSLGGELTDRIDTLNVGLGGRIDHGFDAVHARIDALKRTMIQVGFAQVAALIGALIALIATRA